MFCQQFTPVRYSKNRIARPTNIDERPAVPTGPNTRAAHLHPILSSGTQRNSPHERLTNVPSAQFALLKGHGDGTQAALSNSY